jgi:hypothetical protein
MSVGHGPSWRVIAIGCGALVALALVAVIASQRGATAPGASVDPGVGKAVARTASQQAGAFASAIYAHRCADARAAAVTPEQHDEALACVELETTFPHTKEGAHHALESHRPKVALAIAEELLAKHPRDQEMILLAGLSACYARDRASAKTWVGKIAGEQALIVEQCRQLGLANVLE